jgi:Kef-type K+ transport system membrane component KefB
MELRIAPFRGYRVLGAAIGLLGLISLCLLVFGRLGVGSIVAFLAAGIVIGQVQIYLLKRSGAEIENNAH